MQHDYAHCLDFTETCPKECFRAQLVRDIQNNPAIQGRPLSWMHFKESKECLLYTRTAKDSNKTSKDWNEENYRRK